MPVYRLTPKKWPLFKEPEEIGTSVRRPAFLQFAINEAKS